ncbi:hypothetical protein [Parathermosynechococcus lividus]|nr:hypothetical protein [Thermostichus lividus]
MSKRRSAVRCVGEGDRDIELLYQLGAREVVQPEFEASFSRPPVLDLWHG